MNNAQTFPIRNAINVSDLWAGIGGHFDSLGQIINEFVDNAISNFEANSTVTRNIIITIEEPKDKNDGVKVSIEDSGTGIKNLDAAFSMGSHAGAETPLNEHGFGIKHALASANPSNDKWAIYTRLDTNIAENTIKKIVSPYKLDGFSGELVSESWPGKMNGTGTIVQFTCTYEMFNSIAQGMKGKKAFVTTCDILCEDLGFIYAGVIINNKASITLIVIPDGAAPITTRVGALEPEWEDFVKLDNRGNTKKGTAECDLGSGNVKIKYAFGNICSKPNRELFNNETARKYYQTNMSSSGVEIRVNGRILEYNLFKEIWGIEKHNSYNKFLVTIDLLSSDRLSLPQTRTTKNGFRQGDEKLEKLFDWILKKQTDPVKDFEQCTDEREMFADIAEKRKRIFQSLSSDYVVETEKTVFKMIGNKKEEVRMDMYEFVNNRVIIYEGKRNETRGKDVYQLRMYWDGCVADGIQPNEAKLVGESHTEAVKQIIQYLNTMKDANGNNYNIKAVTWNDF